MKKLFLAGVVTSALLLAACSSDEEAPKEKTDKPVATEKEQKEDQKDKTKENVKDENKEDKEKVETYPSIEEAKAEEDKKWEELEKAKAEREKNIKANNTVQKVNEKVADDEKVSATLTKITWKKKEIAENAIEVTFAIQNNTKNHLSIRAAELTTDGKKVNEEWVRLNGEVEAGKTGEVTLIIRDYKNGDLPALEEKLEMNLNVIERKDKEKKEVISGKEYEVAVSFKK